MRAGEDRDENFRRIGFVAHFLTRQGVVGVVAAISPYRAVREEVRKSIGNFLEVYVNTPLSVCERRDPKGLYKKARAGEICGFTLHPPPRSGWSSTTPLLLDFTPKGR